MPVFRRSLILFSKRLLKRPAIGTKPTRRLALADSYSDSQSFFMFGSEEDPEYSKWLVEKQEARIQDELYLEQREIEMADEILEKLHGHGIESLSSDEKMLLQRVSERLRRKRKLDVID